MPLKWLKSKLTSKNTTPVDQAAVPLLQKSNESDKQCPIWEQVWLSVRRTSQKTIVIIMFNDDRYMFSLLTDRKTGRVYTCFTKNNKDEWEKDMPAQKSDTMFIGFVQSCLNEHLNIGPAFINELRVHFAYPAHDLMFRSFLLKLLKSEVLEVNTLLFSTTATVIDNDLLKFLRSLRAVTLDVSFSSGVKNSELLFDLPCRQQKINVNRFSEMAFYNHCKNLVFGDYEIGSFYHAHDYSAPITDSLIKQICDKLQITEVEKRQEDIKNHKCVPLTFTLLLFPTIILEVYHDNHNAVVKISKKETPHVEIALA